MRRYGYDKAGERAESQQFGRIQLTDGGELLPAARRSTAAYEAVGDGFQWRATAAFG